MECRLNQTGEPGQRDELAGLTGDLIEASRQRSGPLAATVLHSHLGDLVEHNGPDEDDEDRPTQGRAETTQHDPTRGQDNGNGSLRREPTRARGALPVS